MKFFAVLTLVMISYSAFADEENFAKSKEMLLGNIDKRISLIQEHRGCVSAAADKTAMKACHDKHKTDMQGFKTERKGAREQFKANRKASKEAAKAKP